MEDLYCSTCTDYTSHDEFICQECGSKYNPDSKRYIICGSRDHPDVKAATEKLLSEEPDAIIIDESIALKHRTSFPISSGPESRRLTSKDLYIPNIEDMHNDTPKWARGRKSEAVRDSKENPKIGRNDLCSCKSGLKYKRCCFIKK